MIEKTPLLPFSPKQEKVLAKGLYPVADIFLKIYPKIAYDLEESGSRMGARQYVAGAIMAFVFYFALITLVVAIVSGSGLAKPPTDAMRSYILLNTFAISLAVFIYLLLYPKWNATKRMGEMEKDLLFATRHLMIQTSAGIPLFEAIVSLTETHPDEEAADGSERMDYGEVGGEFSRIVVEVRSGKELTSALEEAASRSSSAKFRKVLWQLANSNKTGAKVGDTLKDEVGYLASEQIIMIRSYGSQLGTLSLFYMLGCIIAPTMGVVMLAIGSSMVPSLPLNEGTFIVLLAFLITAQVLFVGLIKSRRPMVSL